jgi:hypothetical protein
VPAVVTNTIAVRTDTVVIVFFRNIQVDFY